MDPYLDQSHMMKPNPDQSIPLDARFFNYRCFRARRRIMNIFAIAASRFRILRRTIIANAEKVILVTKSVVTLHSLLMKKRASQSENYNYYPPSPVN